MREINNNAAGLNKTNFQPMPEVKKDVQPLVEQNAEQTNVTTAETLSKSPEAILGRSQVLGSKAKTVQLSEIEKDINAMLQNPEKAEKFNKIFDLTLDVLNKKGDKEAYEKSLETYNTLKKYLISTCIKIEESFTKIYSTQENKSTSQNKSISQMQNKNEGEDKENEDILKKIKEYKLKTKELEKEVEIIMKLNKVGELEGVLEVKQNYLNQLKYENKSLKNVKEMQEKALNEFNSKNNKRKEFMTIMEKIKKMKEEISIKKGYLKITDDKIKGQMNKIKELEKNNNNIKNNIDIAKKKEKEKSINKDDEIKKEENLINKYENEHNALIEKEKNCKINLKKQSNMLNKLRDDIGNINNDSIEADKKMKELQKKINIIQNEINLKKLKNKEFANGFKNSQNLSNIKKDVIKVRKIKKPFTNDIIFDKYKNQKKLEKIETVNELKKLKNDIEEILGNCNKTNELVNKDNINEMIEDDYN